MEYISILQYYNLKVTPQRLAIVKTLHLNGHMNIDDIYISLKDKFPSISLATIYKNINYMNEKSLILEVKVPNKKTVYELNKKEHCHITCSKCNAIIDVVLDTSDIFKQAKNTSNYDLDSSSIIFNGICPNCLKSNL